VSAVGRQSVGGGGDNGEGEIWEMGKFLKMNLNVDPRIFELFCLKKKRKTMPRGKKTEEGRTKGACVEALGRKKRMRGRGRERVMQREKRKNYRNAPKLIYIYIFVHFTFLLFLKLKRRDKTSLIANPSMPCGMDKVTLLFKASHFSNL
jgi:hypothetical protein